MKRIAIFNGPLTMPAQYVHTWDERNLETGGIGGSEVWAIMLASQFQKDGNKATVFCDCNSFHYAADGVEYIPYRNFKSICKYADYDLVIISRYADVLRDGITAKRIVLMAHDCVYVNCPTFADNTVGAADAYMFQSDFQKEQLLMFYPQLKDKTWFRTAQCVDGSRYSGTVKKKNKMLWSTHKRRGSKFLIEKILPLIRREVPDFEIEVSGYIEDTTDTYFNNPGVKVLGCLSREELAKHQMDSKIWIYPNWGMFDDGSLIDETFCITATENGLAKNAIIVADKTCFSSTLKGYTGFIGADCFPDGQYVVATEEDKERFAKACADAAIKCLKDDKYRKELADSAYKVCKEYTVENMAKSFYYTIDNIPEKKDRGIAPVVDKNQNLPKIQQKQLVVVTGLRNGFNNLPTMWKSIANNLPNSPTIHTTWAICLDTHHAPIILEQVVAFCRENIKNGMGWMVIPGGHKDNMSYGGDMLNPAIQWLKDNWMKGENPWYYILDEDNTMCATFGEKIESLIKEAEEKDKDVILTNMLYETGINAPLNENIFPVSDKDGKTMFYNLPDPSQLVMRLSFIEEIGMIRGGDDYWIPIFKNIEKNKKRVLFPNATDTYLTTHKAIADKKKIHLIYGMLCSDTAKDCTLLVSNNTEKMQAIRIDASEAKEIIKKMV